MNQSFEFLSPEWVEEVVSRVESAKADDPYFRDLVSAFSLTTLYIVKDIPASLRKRCGGANSLAFRVRVERGTVKQIDFGADPRKADVDVVVQVSYRDARKLFEGKLRPAIAVVTGRVKAKPTNGFSGWSKIAAKSVVTAGRILRTARKVPTTFGGKN